MELLESFRLKIGTWILKRKQSRIKRKMYYSNIDSIKSMGIIWDSTNTDQFPHLSKFVQKMHERKIDVSVIGYFPGKILPDQYTAVRYLTCIRRDEVDSFYIPVTGEIADFMDRKLDVLIDLNFNKVFPLRYITSLSMAGFKIGLSGSNGESSYFDLMMDIKRPVDINTFLDNVIFYLEMINSGTEKKRKAKKDL